MPTYQLNAQDGWELSKLLQSVVQAHPPKHQTQTFPLFSATPHRLGGYLQAFGYITPEQLEAVLIRQHYRSHRSYMQSLGTLLVQQQIITPRVLSALLVLQLVDRLLSHQDTSNLRLGEYLVANHFVTPTQLMPVFQQQTELEVHGRHIRLGEILVEQGLLNRPTLAKVLQSQNTVSPHIANEHASWSAHPSLAMAGSSSKLF